MENLPATAAHSPDGAWWWDGWGWLPAISVDRRLWFDGTRWVPRRPPLSWPRWLVAGGLLWLLAAVAWAPATTIVVSHHNYDFTREAVVVLIATGAGGALATIAWGGVLGYTSRWKQMAIAAVTGTVGILFAYAMMMTSGPQPPNSGSDDAASLGVGLFALPTLVALGFLLAIGGGIGHASRGLKR